MGSLTPFHILALAVHHVWRCLPPEPVIGRSRNRHRSRRGLGEPNPPEWPETVYIYGPEEGKPKRGSSALMWESQSSAPSMHLRLNQIRQISTPPTFGLRQSFCQVFFRMADVLCHSTTMGCMTPSFGTDRTAGCIGAEFDRRDRRALAGAQQRGSI